MKLSTKGRYGLRAMVDIACNEKNGAVSIKSIAKRQALSERYLEQLVSLLRKAELIRSVRGAGGGYKLARAANKISVGEVLRALEGDLYPVDCAAMTGEMTCSAEDTCVTKYVWQEINNSIEKTVDHIWLETLVQESSAMQNEASEKII